MRVVSFNLFKISISRKESFEGKITTSQKIDINDLIKEKLELSDEEVVRIKFNFGVIYKDLADLELEGQVVILPTKEELKDIMSEWKNKKIPQDIKIPLFNFIMNKCNVKALGIEDELGLPPHIQLPKITSPKD
jgi:hypothetical protein